MDKKGRAPTGWSKRLAATSEIRRVLFGWLVLSWLVPTVSAQPAPSLVASEPGYLLDEHRSLGYLALDMEQQVGFPVTDADYALLDRLTAQARRALPRQPATYTRHEALAVLNTLAAVLAPYCPTLAPDVGHGLYSAALRARVCDCDVLSLLYLTVADALELPLQAMLAPQHMLLLWEGPGIRILWEPTQAAEQTEAYYTRRMNIADTARRQGSYLRPLSRQEVIGTLYHNRARILLARGKAAAALVDLAHALQKHPGLVAAYYHRAAAQQALGHYSQAITAYTEAITLDPHHADALYGRGSSSFYLGHYETAIRDFDRVISLEPSAADAYYARGMTYQKRGRLREAIADHTLAMVLDSTLVEALYNRGLAHLRLHESQQALADLLVFLRRIAGQPAYAAYVPQAQRLVLALRQGATGTWHGLADADLLSATPLEQRSEYDP